MAAQLCTGLLTTLLLVCSVIGSKRDRQLEWSFRQCCKAHGVPQDCLKGLCSYNSSRLTKEVALREPYFGFLATQYPGDNDVLIRGCGECDYKIVAEHPVQCKYTQNCTEYASEWLHCATDGNNVSECIRKQAEIYHIDIPSFCYARFLSGTAPTLNDIFENAPSSNTCLVYTRVFDRCYKRGIKGSRHKNVCLKPGPECPTFNHTLSSQGQRWFKFYLKSNPGCN